MRGAGQQLTRDEVEWRQLPASSVTQATRVPGIQNQRCNRCLAVMTRANRLPSGAWYCQECLTLGRVTDHTELFRFPKRTERIGDGQLTWQGDLTADQARVSQELIATFDERRDRLLWAVTGAGKTEMLFPLLAHALVKQAQIAIVSPRVDVILELAPRLQQAFANTPIAILYGGQHEVIESSLVLATTHQLLRFYHAFDLVIVDEVDAFPYATVPMLDRAVHQASVGPIIYLTATPSNAMLRAVQHQKLAVSYLARRFHQFPLPKPQVKLISTGLPTRAHYKMIEKMLITRQLLFFVPHIEQLAPLQTWFKQQGIDCQTVHANDPERQQKVAAFRAGDFPVLVTTTILERGVTIARCAVIVWQADAALFSTSALVQMAGRAGRSADSPDDPVIYYAKHYTSAIHQARRQIHQMNRRPTP